MCAQEVFKTFAEECLKEADKGLVVIKEFRIRPITKPIQVFASTLASGLQFETEVVTLSLIICRRAIEGGLKVGKKCAYRLLTACFVLAEKFFQEQHHSLEAYSLLSGIPIYQLVTMEALLLELLEFRVMPEDHEFENFYQGETARSDIANLVQMTSEDGQLCFP